jgi:hypothetical protein
LRGVVDGGVGVAVASQLGDVGLSHRVRGTGELLGEGGERPVGRRQRRPAPVRGDGVDETVRLGGVRDLEAGGDLGPEVVGVSADSVGAGVGGRDHHR